MKYICFYCKKEVAYNECYNGSHYLKIYPNEWEIMLDTSYSQIINKKFKFFFRKTSVRVNNLTKKTKLIEIDPLIKDDVIYETLIDVLLDVPSSVDEFYTIVNKIKRLSVLS